MRYSLLLLIVATSCSSTAQQEGIGPRGELSRYTLEVPTTVRLSATRTAELSRRNDQVEVAEAGRTHLLSALDFPDTHVLAGDLTGDGESEILVELFSSASGSCYELWLPRGATYHQYDDVFCNPVSEPDGTLRTVRRDGPFSHITTYLPDEERGLRKLSRQEPLNRDFSRFSEWRQDGAMEEAIIFLGLPECGEARVVIDSVRSLRESPRGDTTGRVQGEVRVLSISEEEPFDQHWVQVQAPDGSEGWLLPEELGDIGAAAMRHCRARSTISGDAKKPLRQKLQ